jgi:hypothetical protein
MSDDSPDKKNVSGSKKENIESSDQKWVKNVRRRVYDALNVLYAAGVLRKDGKHVTCDQHVIEMTRAIKAALAKDSESLGSELDQNQTAEKTPSNAYDAKLKAEILELNR